MLTELTYCFCLQITKWFDGLHSVYPLCLQTALEASALWEREKMIAIQERDELKSCNTELKNQLETLE